MRPLDILHVTPYCDAAWAYGGIPRVVGALTEGLARRGHRVRVLATDVLGAASRLPSGRRRSAAGVETRIFRNLSNRVAYHLQFFTPLGLGGELRRTAADFDVAHLHGCRHLPGVLAARALRRAETPYVLSPHGTAPRIERRRLAKRLFDLLVGGRVLPGAARLIAVSEAERAQLAELGAADARVRVVGNPLPTEDFDTLPARGVFRSRHGVAPDAPLLLFLGKLTPRKRVDLLLDAFARLRARDAIGDAARLVVAGNDMGSLAELRRHARRLGIADQVLFVGLLPGDARLEALVDADVLAYPSEHEIFGLAALEALLCGTPAVVADDSGCGEVVAGVGGWVVTAGDASALARALEDILADPDASRARARDAARRTREFYSIDAVVDRLEAVYAELVEGRP